jgi:peptidoglycan L-alanyl-D-glutamate endopeptidase CwlK
MDVGVAVFFLMVALYFLLACFAAWLLLFPAGREVFTAILSGFGTKLGQKFSDIENQTKSKSGSLLDSIHSLFAALWRWMCAHYWLVLACLGLLALPPLLAIFLGSRSSLDGFDAPVRNVNVQIADLLKGELLVAPLALPPAVFGTQEVLIERPMLVSASRNWDLLNADFTQRLLMTFKIMKDKYGYDMAIIEGYRSPERQNLLAEMGAHVTNAKAFQSYHQYGLAADCAFLRDGKLVISEKDPWAMKGYELYGEVAESMGLTWGGRWKMMDFGHTELRKPEVMKK